MSTNDRLEIKPYYRNSPLSTHYLVPTAVVDRSRVPSFSSIERTGGSLGNLECLPVEIQQQILVDLDLWTLVNVMKTNSRGIELVESLPEYCELIQDVGLTLSGKGARSLLSQYSISRLHAALRASHCGMCEDRTAPFFYLGICCRLCYDCFWLERGHDSDNMRVRGTYATYVKR